VILHSARKRDYAKQERIQRARTLRSKRGAGSVALGWKWIGPVIKPPEPNLFERGEAVDGERVSLDGAAVEQDLADVEAGGADLGGEDELRRGGDHVHVVPRGDQVPHHLQRTHADGITHSGQSRGGRRETGGRTGPRGRGWRGRSRGR
jgi:hypothetical protein